MREIHILGGGTFSHVRSHLALAAPSFGTTARQLSFLCRTRCAEMSVRTHLTKMADHQSQLVTNHDVAGLIHEIATDMEAKIFFGTAAICDWEGMIIEEDCPGASDSKMFPSRSGKYEPRLKTRGSDYHIAHLTPYKAKLIGQIRKRVDQGGYGRKDMTVVGFKTTCGAEPEQQYLAGLEMLKENSLNLVFANDVATRLNMVITPEEAVYHETHDRHDALKGLVEMAYLRSQLTFTQSTVVEGEIVSWGDLRVPANLRAVVDHAVDANAYKPFKGATVGHFATKLSDTEFLTSIRKSNFNKLRQTGLVYVRTDGPDTVLAYGAKPSVGGQSQRIVFKDHPGYDCIVHFHCPLREHGPDLIPVVSQREVECGSHECGRNTSRNLGRFTLSDNTGSYVIKAVMLDNHGPNIVFDKETPAKLIIDFIERNFDLSKKTGGYQLPK